MNLFTRIKNYILAALAIVGAGLGILVLYWKRKSEVDEALLDQQALDKTLQKQDDEIAANNKELLAEEQKRNDLENDKDKNPSNVSDIVDFLNRRK